jgi:hypothetical protein
VNAAVTTADGDPRLWLEDVLSAELGVEKVMVVRLREGNHEFAFATMFRLGVEGGGVSMRLTQADCRMAASALDRIADEMGKRASEAR